jgi:hypothetical protein
MRECTVRTTRVDFDWISKYLLCRCSHLPQIAKYGSMLCISSHISPFHLSISYSALPPPVLARVLVYTLILELIQASWEAPGACISCWINDPLILELIRRPVWVCMYVLFLVRASTDCPRRQYHPGQLGGAGRHVFSRFIVCRVCRAGQAGGRARGGRGGAVGSWDARGEERAERARDMWVREPGTVHARRYADYSCDLTRHLRPVYGFTVPYVTYSN